MNQVDPQKKAQQDPGLISILTGINATAGQNVAMRARRSVLNNLMTHKEQQLARRRNITLGLAISFAVFLMITPVIWNAVEEFLDEEHLGDLTSQLTLSALVLIPAALAALFAGWKNGQLIHPSKRNF
jgi:hypothetical protein